MPVDLQLFDFPVERRARNAEFRCRALRTGDSASAFFELERQASANSTRPHYVEWKRKERQ